MGNSKVALLRYVKIAEGWRRVRVEATRRGRGRDERLDAPEGQEILQKGQFQLRWHKGSRAVYKGVGLNLQEAITPATIRLRTLRRNVPPVPQDVCSCPTVQGWLGKRTQTPLVNGASPTHNFTHTFSLNIPFYRTLDWILFLVGGYFRYAARTSGAPSTPRSQIVWPVL